MGEPVEMQEIIDECNRLQKRLFVDQMEMGDCLADMQTRLSMMQAERDRLIEFGEYLAKAAEQFGERVNDHAVVCDEITCDLDEATNAELAMADSWRALKSAIYGFRKRAKLEDKANG